jgi:hypothetical protein
VTMSRGASAGRAWRGRRWSQESRKSRTLRSGPDLLGGGLYAWWRERSGAFPVESLAADHGCRQVRRMLQCGQSRLLAREQKQARSWLDWEAARNPSEKRKAATGRYFSVVDPAGCCSPDTVDASGRHDNTASACGIQDPQGAIVLRAPSLSREPVIGRTAQRPVGRRQ